MKLELTRPQLDLIQNKSKYRGFFAGLGSGKSQALAVCAMLDAIQNPKALIAIYEPTYSLLKLIIVPRVIELLEKNHVKFTYNKQDNRIYSNEIGDIIFRSLDNPELIVGYESFRSHIDELDVLSHEKAKMAWQKIIARNRQLIIDANGSPLLNQVTAYSTPEGFKFCYERWVEQGGEDYDYIQASTTSNPYLPDGYIQSLRDSYPPELIDAYIEGNFVNLTSGTVYRAFDRSLNATMVEDNGISPLHIGVDFNVGNMSAIVSLVADNKLYIIDEFSGAFDTPDLIKLIEDKYKGRQITYYPDASGNNRKSVDASKTDISLLKQTGAKVAVNPTNPSVRDRVNSVNVMLCNANGERRLLINPKCKEITKCLEQLAYDPRTNAPDKTSGLDHMTDGLGYIVAKLFPIKSRRNTGVRQQAPRIIAPRDI